jgi:mono/diheme cytochrome c family protein
MEVITMADKRLYGVTALFNNPDKITAAAKKVKEAGFIKWDVHSPYPLHGMEKAMGLKPSLLGIVTLISGLSGTTIALFFMWWTMSVDYPMVIGGKPFFALPAFIPVTFEVTVILATVSTVAAMFAFFFKLPRNDFPLHDTDYMQKVSCDHFGILIEAEDPKFDETETSRFLQNLEPVQVDTIHKREKETYPVFEPKFLGFLAAVTVIVSAGTYVTLNKLMFIDPFNWMMEQDKIIPQSRTELFEDERGMRLPVEGTVARGFIPYPFMGQTDLDEVLSNPFLPTKENLDLGEKKYLTFCSPCHGNFGDGDSRLNEQFPNPPSLHSDRARGFSDGWIYHVITNGQNIMSSYAPQITRMERWAIVNYIRVLQRAKNATDSDLEFVRAKNK